MDYSPTELELFVRQRAPEIARDIQQAASRSRNEADLVAEVEDVLEKFERNFDITLHPDRERTLINGRADAVYNRFVIEYEPPGSLRKEPGYRHNKHAIGQVKQYMEELERLERHRKERLAGVVLDGYFYIFVRYRDDHWRVDDPMPVNAHSTETFLRYLLSLSTELALTPENLVRDFGENSTVARLVVSTLYEALGCTDCPKVHVLFQQWQRQFSEITGWGEQSSADLSRIARNYGVKEKHPDPFRFFFAVHTYYATFIKLLAVQVAHFYMMPKVSSGLRQQASAPSDDLRRYLAKMERGGIFKDLGINNFLEGDFFGWYLDIWDDAIDKAIRRVVAELANYSLVTLDVDPDETRDLLKKLYQNLMPRKLRHALGEYYTPDWLAERLLNQLGYTGDPGKRLLDPACGSGTFLVLAVRCVREYAKEKMLPPAEVLEQVLQNIVGFDLNPLAVISARTNYLLALGDLLETRQGEVTIPVYLADSILTPSQGADLFTMQSYSFNTAVGRFSVPRSLVDARSIDRLADLLEECVGVRLSREQFRARLLATFPALAGNDAETTVALDLYEQLHTLDAQGINGIWARIIKNAFAPLFAGRFDYVAGNPPWVNWESLPADYRQDTKPLWERYGLFPHGGMDTILGKGKKDISMLMTYVATNQYLRPRGRLGFIITQSVFKTTGAGQGFRRFRLGEVGERLNVLYVDDMSAIKPFEGAANRTAIVILEKGRLTNYPVPYALWRKTARGQGLRDDDLLDEILAKTAQSRFVAEPVDEGDTTSPWLTGRPRALKTVRRVIGRSDYQARAGSNTGGANAVYWLEIIAQRPDGLLVISNLTKGAKRKVENVQAAIEPDLVYPLLRGRDVSRWQATPQAYILMVQDPEKRRGYAEDWLSATYPKTYAYLKRFEDALRERSGFKRYFRETDPFYSMFNIGDYTFAPYKVVWPEVSNDLRVAVIGRAPVTGSESKVVVPDHTLILIPCESRDEAHYVCAALNSSPSQFTVRNYIVMHPDTHVMERVRIPRYDPQNATHRQLSALSQQAHAAVAAGRSVAEIEAEVDRLAARLWGLTDEELADIQQSLAELG